jgi:hypothetical protein
MWANKRVQADAAAQMFQTAASRPALARLTRRTIGPPSTN